VSVTKGFKFVNKEDSRTILEKYYHNPPDESVSGLIFPEDRGVFTDSSYFFVITYSDMGHVEDDDAEDMNYDELLTELKKDQLNQMPGGKTGLQESMDCRMGQPALLRQG
jgi:uncharacterized membrane-anchored protein